MNPYIGLLTLPAVGITEWHMRKVDVVVVGAGPAGLSLARSLAGSGLSLALVEQQPLAAVAEPAFDGRKKALRHGYG